LTLSLTGCPEKKPETPENAFQEFTHAALRNRRKDLQMRATDAYIKQLEGVFDLMVVSAAWPADVSVTETRMLDNGKALLVASGVDRAKKIVFGVFALKLIDARWMVVNGGWNYMSETPPSPLSSADPAWYYPDDFAPSFGNSNGQGDGQQ
jgi:hypothetical protein